MSGVVSIKLMMPTTRQIIYGQQTVGKSSTLINSEIIYVDYTSVKYGLFCFFLTTHQGLGLWHHHHHHHHWCHWPLSCCVLTVNNNWTRSIQNNFCFSDVRWTSALIIISFFKHKTLLLLCLENAKDTGGKNKTVYLYQAVNMFNSFNVELIFMDLQVKKYQLYSRIKPIFSLLSSVVSCYINHNFYRGLIYLFIHF